MEKLLGTPGWIGSRGGEWGTKRGGFTSVGLDIAESSRAPAGMDDAGYAFTAGVEETERETLERIYRESVTIAVVGASADPSKPAHRIPAYLQEQGYRIHPVNPRGGELLGEPVATTLAEVDGPVDVVDVFRPAAEAVDIARQAVTVGAKVLWLQLGIRNDEARQLAEKAGLSVVMDRCMGATHRELGLGPARSSGRASGRNSPVIERRVPRNETSPDRLARLAVTIALAASVALALGVLVLWAVPSLLTRHPSSGVTATDRLKAVNDVRAPLVAFLVALGAAGTLWFTGRTYILNREGHVTDRYTSAVGQLGDDSAYVRVGGIYALERIGNDSPKDRRTIIYVLGAFIRDRSKRERSGPGPPTEDVQAAIRVAGRLTARATDTQLDLRGADLRNADLASLPPEPEWVLLRGADNTGATGRIIDRIGRP